ncbi:MAG: hypothetical protein CM1200mP29_12340 [Verrucomicrobiota bacterium]|nr:MAG: hypothetical protein CM1200mP29_12340 [Verrucomicrobiota bacterium]
MLDYSIEVEHFDNHLGKILAMLERARAQIDNTLIVATSDHGISVPTCQGGRRTRRRITSRWRFVGQAGNNGNGRVVTDYVSFADIAPTFLEAAGVAKLTPIKGAGERAKSVLTSFAHPSQAE